jgi:hypothetical protein
MPILFTAIAAADGAERAALSLRLRGLAELVPEVTP